jgi:hypothetical protein
MSHIGDQYKHVLRRHESLWETCGFARGIGLYVNTYCLLLQGVYINSYNVSEPRNQTQ